MVTCGPWPRGSKHHAVPISVICISVFLYSFAPVIFSCCGSDILFFLSVIFIYCRSIILFFLPVILICCNVWCSFPVNAQVRWAAGQLQEGDPVLCQGNGAKLHREPGPDPCRADPLGCRAILCPSMPGRHCHITTCTMLMGWSVPLSCVCRMPMEWLLRPSCDRVCKRVH